MAIPVLLHSDSESDFRLLSTTSQQYGCCEVDVHRKLRHMKLLYYMVAWVGLIQEFCSGEFILCFMVCYPYEVICGCYKCMYVYCILRVGLKQIPVIFA